MKIFTSPTADNRAYLTMVLRISAQILLLRTSFMLGTLSEIGGYGLMKRKRMNGIKRALSISEKISEVKK